MNHAVAAVILAGGENKRLNGKNKAFLQIDGRPLLDRVHGALRQLFSEITIVTNKPLDYLAWNVKITTDVFHHRSSLTGLHAGLLFTQAAQVFVCACDTPFLKPSVIKAVLKNIDDAADIVVPATSNGMEPLCAVYSKHCLKTAENCLQRKMFSIRNIYDALRVKTVPEEILRQQDPDLISFFNINTFRDLETARNLLTTAENDRRKGAPS